ncbi:MAG: trigger factor [Treponema sp.]|nr:trigger factor [Treponema sp.]
MKVSKEVTKIENSAVKLTATIAKEDVASGYKDAMARYSKNIQIPGFRKGHVPTSVLERKYGEGLKAEITGELIDKALNEIISAEDMKDMRPLPYSQPKFDGDDFPVLDTDKDLTFTVVYDIFPQVQVGKLDGIKIKVPQAEVTQEDMDKELKSIQERNAAVIDKKDDAPVEKDDIVTIDYKEVGDDGAAVAGSEREGFVFTEGSGENIYKIDDDILGMKKDETKVITKKYAKNDKNADLAGTTKKISVTVKQIKVRNLPALDDDLAQDVNEKYKTLDDLKKDISRSMNLAKDRKVADIKRQELLKQLLEKTPFDLPKSMVQAENDGRWNMMAQQFKTTPEELEKMVSASGQTKETMLTQWVGDTEKALKSRIIVDQLLRDRNISVTPDEIEDEYKKIAEQNDMSLDEVKDHYKDLKAKEYLVDEVKENKLFDTLYTEVKLEKGDKMTFSELFKEEEEA